MRATVAAMTAFLLYHALNLPQGYWAVFTTVIVIQSNVGATLTTSWERLGGTILGALVGALAAWLHPRTPVGLGVAVALAVAFTALAAAVRPSLRAAPVTAVIMLISPSGAAVDPLRAALLRVFEIIIGSVVAVAATLLIFPARAHRAAVGRIRIVLNDLAAAIDAAADRLNGSGEADLLLMITRVRRGLAQVEAAVTDAARERSTRLGDDTLPEAVVRTLWRVRNDAVVLMRTVQEGLPEPAGAVKAARRLRASVHRRTAGGRTYGLGHAGEAARRR